MSFLRRSWIVLWPLLVAIVTGLLACHRLNDVDLFWHLDVGRSVLAEHARVVTEHIAIPELGSKCIAHEWLWDLALAWLHARGGFALVGAFVVMIAALAGGALGLLVTRWEPRPRFWTAFAITCLVVPVLVVRLNERPESVSFVLWPIGLLLAKRVAERARPRDAVLLVGLAILWAQLHLSVLAFGIAAAILLLPRVGTKRAPTLALVGLVVALCTTAAGTEVLTVRTRVSGYVSEHVNEWKPLAWPMLDPFAPGNAIGPAFALLVVAAIVAAFGNKRRFGEVGLALLGLLLAYQARRTATPAAILIAPLALRGLHHHIVRAGASLVAFLFVVRTIENAETFSRPTLEEGAFPTAAARMLETAGEHRALTTYRTGPPLAFATRGRVRGFVDSRTPLFSFTDVDLAIAQTVWTSPVMLPTAIERYRFDIAVVERGFPVCRALATDADWAPIFVEPGFTTFAKKDSPLATARIEKVRPCGDTYLDDTTCDTDSDFARLAPFSAPEFLSYLRAERALRCAKGRFDGDAILAMIPAQASGFEPSNDALRAWLLALANRPSQSIALLAPHVKKGKAWVLADSLAPLSRGGADDDLRELIEPLAKEDDVDPSIVIALALACARQGDERCAYLETARAVAAGRSEVLPAVCFLRTRNASRNDAEAWLDALGRRSGARIRCP